MTIASTVRTGFRAATSKTAQRTYVYATLLTITSSILYGIAILGYLAFYREYVPHKVRSAPVYLQYGPLSPAAPSAASNKASDRLFAAGSTLYQHLQSDIQHIRHPYALTDLRGLGLKTDQDYDVSIVLSLPQTPSNQAVGNFMVEIALAASASNSASAAIAAAERLPPTNPRDFLETDGKRVLFAAARPALMAYTDPLIAQATRLTLLPLHFFAPEAASRTRLIVPMAESLSFSGAGGPKAGLPAVLYLELRTNGLHELQTYGAEVVFAARLSGMRWLMYHHRIFSFLLLTTVWWLVEVVSMMAALVILSLVFGGQSDADSSSSRPSAHGSNSSRIGSAQRALKKPDDDSDDDEQHPFERKPEVSPNIKREPFSIKKEENDSESGVSQLAAIPHKFGSSGRTTSHAKTEQGHSGPAYKSELQDDSTQSAHLEESFPSASDDGLDGDQDSNEPDDDDDDNEPVLDRSSSQSGREKARRPKESAVTTGRASNSAPNESDLRQRLTKKELLDASEAGSSLVPKSPMEGKQDQSQNDYKQSQA
ncbi:hypothetical protein SEPCBS119000_006737 [Sporothrix epigloea]|uniref:Tubulin-tyrosine ligase n=1 Tax=Sporothrix epigloea TaxID=1892477 RepID=A0ABP0E4N8_9PEZI